MDFSSDKLKSGNLRTDFGCCICETVECSTFARAGFAHQANERIFPHAGICWWWMREMFRGVVEVLISSCINA